MLINQYNTQTFCLSFRLTGVLFRGELHHVGDVACKKSSAGQSETGNLRYQIVALEEAHIQYFLHIHKFCRGFTIS